MNTGYGLMLICQVTDMKILIINGPNLNLMGVRKPEIYGEQRFETFMKELRKRFSDARIDYYQSNYEGKLIDKLHAANFSHDGIIINPMAYAYTSLALRDAIATSDIPVCEVRISSLSPGGEEFKKQNYIEDVCIGTVEETGLEGYATAIQVLMRL